ncbi:hypothetical protein I350_02759 [Cryptococcus amylolentus CBS 6273]|uniref:Uncharacterized protein n=1 Tax=Cryptococcus amylolentus CBS 6273 TaxID=1296118 RepID=A0A1E3K7V1_9TREE|nr:hypothetical protein I350_02759 [Cryptococcus amylolentus CBS 6273]
MASFTGDQDDYDIANKFVSCLCYGKQAEGIELGKDLISEYVGVCESCTDTPDIVKEDLQGMLTVCTVQAQNGTADLASYYRPQVYHTNITEPVVAYY